MWHNRQIANSDSSKISWWLFWVTSYSTTTTFPIYLWFISRAFYEKVSALSLSHFHRLVLPLSTFPICVPIVLTCRTQHDVNLKLNIGIYFAIFFFVRGNPPDGPYARLLALCSIHICISFVHSRTRIHTSLLPLLHTPFTALYCEVQENTWILLDRKIWENIEDIICISLKYFENDWF